MALTRVSDVFRIRRHQPTRLEGFVDASFAFAVTLVVISFGHVPESVPEMLHALRGVPTFAVCFLLIARTWRSHRDWSCRYDIEDDASIRLSLILVFLVLVYVYPLRLLFALMFAGISHGWLMDEALEVHSYFELRAAFAVFGLGYASIWVLISLLYRHAFRLRAAVGLDPAEVLATQFHVLLPLGFAAIALISVVAATTLPFETLPWSIPLPGLIYFLMSLFAIALKRRWLQRINDLPSVAAI